MPVITVYQHGGTAGTAPMRNDHARGKRDDVAGWSAKTARSNTRFLQSVLLDSLTGVGFAFTLTLKNCPQSAADWHKVRRAFLKRLERAGMVRGHWVTEWQRRGVPHLHGVAYFPADRLILETSGLIVTHWLDLVHDKYTAAPWSQNVKPITNSLGWLQYLAKHAARGANHYQRSKDSIPAGWQMKTGRMWGKVGEWETGDPSKFDVPMPAFHAYRRRFRAYQVAEARAKGDWRSLRFSRRCLRTKGMKQMPGESDEVWRQRLIRKSSVRGVSTWIPAEAQMAIVHWLAADGYTVEST